MLITRPKKLKSLDARGATHLVVPLVVVFMVAVVGTYFLVGSHAASVSKPKIRSVSLSVPSVKGYQNGNVWCADVILYYRVTTSGVIKNVSIDSVKTGANDGLTTYLSRKGKSSLWTGSLAHYGTCVAKKGDKVHVQQSSVDSITASYSGGGITQSAPDKTVMIN